MPVGPVAPTAPIGPIGPVAPFNPLQTYFVSEALISVASKTLLPFASDPYSIFIPPFSQFTPGSSTVVFTKLILLPELNA
jgi:hypothetical protein